MASSTTVQSVTTVYTTRPILGPLTTVFTPPPECSVAAVRGTPLNIGFRAQTCVGGALLDEPTCWPEVTAAAPSPTPPFHGWGFYSPGISCPVGHTTACGATQGSHTGWEIQYALEEGETAVGCCPTGFACSKFGSAQTCVSTASESILTASCSGGSFVSSDYGTFPIVYTSKNAENTSTATLSRLPIAAPMIQINWRSQDLIDASQASPNPTNSEVSSASASSSRSISAGASAGAVITGVVVLFGIAAAVFILMRRRKARTHNHAQPTSDMVISSKHHDQKEVMSSASELSSGYMPPEMSESLDPRELSASQSPIELPDSLREPRMAHHQP